MSAPSNARRPRVSIGLPVYNGERYLREALDSILDQSFEEFEVIVCDNASTDATEEIARTYSERDARIRYHRNRENLGASRNFNLSFELTSGEYFRWAAHDDRIAPRYLARCVEVLDRDSSVVLCHSNVEIIGTEGESLGHFDYAPDYAASEMPNRRLRDVLAHDRWCYDVFGLIRRAVMQQTLLLDAYVASDRVLRAELALRGRYHLIQERLFLNRDHPGRSVRTLPAHHLRAGWFDPAKEGSRILPHWRILFEYFRGIRRAPVAASERLRCALRLGRWLGADLNWARMGADLVIVAVPSSWGLFYRGRSGGAGWQPGSGDGNSAPRH